MNILTQQEKAKQLYDLHHSGKLLILPNIWDVLGAKLLQDIGYAAVATASASIAYANGYDDGEHIPFSELLFILNRIAGNVNSPVTADIESGYAENKKELAQNIRKLIEAGIVGINIEDTNKKTNALLPLEEQCKNIELIKNISAQMNMPLFINARTDCYIHAGTFDSVELKLEETIKRGLAYKAAGADCFYPILVNDESEIKMITAQLNIPVNILTMPGMPSLNTLHSIGVSRVSLGPSFLKYAIKAMQSLAIKLQGEDGLDEIINNDITSAYLKQLVSA